MERKREKTEKIENSVKAKDQSNQLSNWSRIVV